MMIIIFEIGGGQHLWQWRGQDCGGWSPPINIWNQTIKVNTAEFSSSSEYILWWNPTEASGELTPQEEYKTPEEVDGTATVWCRGKGGKKNLRFKLDPVLEYESCK